MKSKFWSRKFIVSVAAVLMSVSLPIVYKKFEIDSTLTLMAMGIISALAVTYGGMNVLARKYGEKNE